VRVTRRRFLTGTVAAAAAPAIARTALGQDRHRGARLYILAGPVTVAVDNLKAMQDALLDAGAVEKRVPLDEHYTAEFTPVRL
jgi:hypothetical protein